MRREVVLLVVIALGGCLPDQAKDVAACRTEADRFYPTYEAVDPNNPSSQFIIACMATKGYQEHFRIRLSLFAIYVQFEEHPILERSASPLRSSLFVAACLLSQDICPAWSLA